MKNLFRLFTMLVVAASLTSCGYNSMVEKREVVSQKWANVESAYQRRSDLIPSLVNTVKGAANFEQSTLEKVIKARSEATSVKLDPSNLSEDDIAKYQAAQGAVSSSLSRLLAVVENYPDLKANEGFLQLQNQLEGTENRIKTERDRFNEAVQDYNTYISKIPQNLIAGMFGFKPKGYFKADAGAEKAPEVKF